MDPLGRIDGWIGSRRQEVIQSRIGSILRPASVVLGGQLGGQLDIKAEVGQPRRLQLMPLELSADIALP
jgi:hypothetical protein